jgi:predicted metal-dependent hydrolase
MSSNSEPVVFDLDGRPIPLRIKRNKRARRIILRIDTAKEGIALTLPPRTSLEKGLALAEEKSGWIKDRLEALPKRVPFVDGALIPFLGAEHVLRHRPQRRGVAWREGGEINVTGRSEYLARRTMDWLKDAARREILSRVSEKTVRLGVKAGRVSLRDTRSRWGSCSKDGNLSFCWRLVMAPELVLDYVVAHEVAHISHHNHSPDFWKLADQISDDLDQGRRWLSKNAQALHRYG